ncbi:hypothetical protein EYF80_042807 [Liparis tanakae]|uniref:Uncharacterized protein n=1 Tax=Liparis tanakae TaxID=230148 RepID=A0A4Z2G2C8_9TELE|nr:hypothetical protein EYF80_042807 [Liparis tanakae]
MPDLALLEGASAASRARLHARGDDKPPDPHQASSLPAAADDSSNLRLRLSPAVSVPELIVRHVHRWLSNDAKKLWRRPLWVHDAVCVQMKEIRRCGGNTAAAFGLGCWLLGLTGLRRLMVEIMEIKDGAPGGCTLVPKETLQKVNTERRTDGDGWERKRDSLVLVNNASAALLWAETSQKPTNRNTGSNVTTGRDGGGMWAIGYDGSSFE